jgi:hypothetical protein
MVNGAFYILNASIIRDVKFLEFMRRASVDGGTHRDFEKCT